MSSSLLRSPDMIADLIPTSMPILAGAKIEAVVLPYVYTDLVFASVDPTLTTDTVILPIHYVFFYLLRGLFG